MLKKKLVGFYLTPWTMKLIRTTYLHYKPYLHETKGRQRDKTPHLLPNALLNLKVKLQQTLVTGDMDFIYFNWQYFFGIKMSGPCIYVHNKIHENNLINSSLIIRRTQIVFRHLNKIYKWYDINKI